MACRELVKEAPEPLYPAGLAGQRAELKGAYALLPEKETIRIVFSREVMPELSPGEGNVGNTHMPASVVDRMGQYGTESGIDIAFPFR